MNTSGWFDTVNFINSELTLDVKMDSYQAGYLALLLGLLSMRPHIHEHEDTTKLIHQLCAQLLGVEASAVFDRLELSAEGEVTWLAGYAESETARRVEPSALIFALVSAIPSGASGMIVAWSFVDHVERVLGCDESLSDAFKSYVDGSADQEAAVYPEAMLRELGRKRELAPIVAHIRARLEGRKDQAGAQHDLKSLKQALAVRLDELRPLIAQVFGEDQNHQRKLNDLMVYLESDTFRVAVLGEFKRGKSTLINALVGEPDLMPADTLPCTSALTEIQAGHERTFMRQDGSTLSSYVPSVEAEFRARAGGASTSAMGHGGVGAEAAADSVPRWRVTIPSGFLQRTAISVIDTPGLREDHVRDILAKREALRADAAIVVMNATQLASLDELQLIEEMKLKAHNLIIVINKIDLVKNAERPRLKAHAIERIREKTDAINDDRILLFSAGEAERALKEGQLDSPWLKELEQLQRLIIDHLVESRGNDKQSLIQKKVQRLVDEYKELAQHKLRSAEQHIKSFRDMEQLTRDANHALQRAQAEVKTATRILEDSSKASQALAAAFDKKLPDLIEALRQAAPSWDSNKSPITSPKQFTEEIAKQAQHALLDLIQGWSNTGAVVVIEEHINKSFNDAIDNVGELIQYIHATTGRSKANIIQQITSETFHVDPDAFNTGESNIGSVMLHGVISVIVGYIIADVILYYMLGLISGFLNPILLAAAVVGAIALALLGQGALKDKIRGKIIDEIHNKLKDASTREKIHAAINKSIEEVFKNISRDFKNSCIDLIEEARAQEAIAKDRMQRFLNDRGVVDRDAYHNALVEEREQAERFTRKLEKLRDVFVKKDSALKELPA